MDKSTTEHVGMTTNPSPGELIKEMLIAFLGGGSLGLVILVVVVAIIEHFK